MHKVKVVFQIQPQGFQPFEGWKPFVRGRLSALFMAMQAFYCSFAGGWAFFTNRIMALLPSVLTNLAS